MASVPEESVLRFCGEEETGYCTDTIQCNALQCNENTIPLQGQCLCSLCLVWLSSENDLKFSSLPYTDVKLWCGTKQTLGLDSYFFCFVPVYSHWDCNNNPSKIVMASDSPSPRHAHPQHILIH